MDDGSDHIADLVPPDPRLCYMLLAAKHTVGAKRNRACELAQGDIIVHWDDDDRSQDCRLSYQMSAVSQGAADICGLSTVLFFEPRSSRAWTYVYPASRRSWLHGATLCYRKTVWQRHRFPDLNEGEDARFIWSLTGTRIMALKEMSFYVALFTATTRAEKEPVMGCGTRCLFKIYNVFSAKIGSSMPNSSRTVVRLASL